jgi:hypothetical protein
MINSKEIDSIIEKQIYGLFIYIAQKAGRKVFIGKDISWVSAAPSAWPNFIFDFHLNPDELNSRIREINADIEQLNAPPLCIVPDDGHTGPLTAELEDNGLRLSAQWTGMAMDLDLFQMQPLPEGFVIHAVNDLTLLEEWCTVASKYLFNNSPLDINLFSHFINDDNVKMYLGRYNGIPVASSLMYLSDKVAGLYMIATSNEYRKRGFGSAITSYPMSEAKNADYKTAILHATAAGKGIYKKIGFVGFKGYNIFWKVGKKYKV